jgi:hypothetical protein
VGSPRAKEHTSSHSDSPRLRPNAASHFQANEPSGRHERARAVEAASEGDVVDLSAEQVHHVEYTKTGRASLDAGPSIDLSAICAISAVGVALTLRLPASAEKPLKTVNLLAEFTTDLVQFRRIRWQS